MSALGKEVGDVDCVGHDLPEMSRVDGLLGLSFLKRFRVSIGFRDGNLEIVVLTVIYDCSVIRVCNRVESAGSWEN